MNKELTHNGVGEGDEAIMGRELLDELGYGKPPILPTEAKERKKYPMFSGLIQYFPRALAVVSHQSYRGNQQHHPDKPLHWDMSKSTDEKDCIIRHMAEGEWEAVAWRALANLERELQEGYEPFKK